MAGGDPEIDSVLLFGGVELSTGNIVCVCVCVCVSRRKKETDRGGREKERKMIRKS